MFLNDLAKVGRQLQHLGLIPPDSHIERDIKWVIDLDTEGNFQSFGALDARHLVGKEYKYRGKNPAARCLVEDLLYVLPPKLILEKLKRDSSKHYEDFISQVKAVCDHVAFVTPVLTFLTGNLEPFKEAVEASEINYEKGIKDNICFRISGKFPHLIPEVQQAWIAITKEHNKVDSKASGQCLITGEHNVAIARTHKKVKAASMVSFNEASFNHYGKDQAMNCPMSDEGALNYLQALEWLVDSPDHHVNHLFGKDSRAVWWLEDAEGLPMLKPEETVKPFEGLGFLISNDEPLPYKKSLTPRDVKDIVRSAWTGKCLQIETPTVKLLVLQKNTGRWIPQYESFRLDEVLDRVANFQSCVTVPEFKGMKTFSIHGLAKSLEPKDTTKEGLTVNALAEYLYLGHDFDTTFKFKVVEQLTKQYLDSGISSGMSAWLNLITYAEEIEVNTNDVAYKMGQLFYLTQWAHDSAYETSQGVVLKRVREVQEEPARMFGEIMEIFEQAVFKLNDRRQGSATYLSRIRQEIFEGWDRTQPMTVFTEEDSVQFFHGSMNMEKRRYSKKEDASSASVDAA